MPVRFQVDSDFYDHPKTIDATDAAVALWCRAGSYSAAKLLDGFIPEAMLARLSQSPQEAAGELVRRGLWRRVRNGYQFHNWEDRGNLTRERVEAERSADRQRKRAQRASEKGSSGTVLGRLSKSSGDPQETGEPSPDDAPLPEKPQVSGQIVRPDSEPDSGVTPDGIRGLSVSVSESVSVLSTTARKRASPRPPGWSPNDRHRSMAEELELTIDHELEKFCDYHDAKGSTFKDWDAALRTWLRNAAKFNGGGPASPYDRTEIARQRGIPEAWV